LHRLVAIQLATGDVHLGQSGFALSLQQKVEAAEGIERLRQRPLKTKQVASREKQSCV